MFPRSYNFSSGPKLLLAKAWLQFPKFIISPMEVGKSLEVQNLDFDFVILQVLIEIHVAPIHPKEIVELLNS
jgi:hypothetical protein